MEKPNVLSSLDHYLTSPHLHTFALPEWYQGLTRADAKELARWTVTKVEHMKNFHFSAVLHESLCVTVQHHHHTVQQGSDGTASLDAIPIFVERMKEADEVTIGWKWVQPPRLTGWWFKRLLLGYFSDPVRGGVALLNSSSAVSQWRAIGYSGSDRLRDLGFDTPGVPLVEFARILDATSRAGVAYDATDKNCFWFAEEVFRRLREGPWPCVEKPCLYAKHQGKFAGLSIRAVDLVTKWIANPLVNQQEKEGVM
ncbi:hypothetical protein BJX99DRAFT_260930 [Aspergillus californicus]